MKRNTYTVTEIGGKHSGYTSEVSISDEIIFNRDEISYILKVLRKGNDSDKKFAKKIFNTLCPSIHCECCGKRLIVSDNGHDDIQSLYDRNLCSKCWNIMKDTEFALKYDIDYLRTVQKIREDWCDKKINYLVNKHAIVKCIDKFKELYPKRYNEIMRNFDEK